ncbi:MAG: thioredoxin family protein, partial [Acetobacteraceae bacterium]|nr:thioredoxin family protein [Acetobacteraceae bacterium]
VLALAGGLILNLMPCVFPVLAMKAVSLASGAQRGAVRAHAVSYSAGVVLAFAGLGGALLALRALGAASGWGFQFQSPVFVTFMAWLLFAIGLNLSGVFEFGGWFMGRGSALAAQSGHAGSFFTGLLAVVVATPCTAPFMGAAIAAALTAPPATALAVFLAMGMGLAAPTLLLAATPGLARLAPRPGRWMFLLRQALAFPMYAAAAWLVWVLSEEAGSPGVLAALAGLVLIGFAAWAYGASHLRHGAGAWIGRTLALAACLAAAVLLNGVGALQETPPARAAQTGAEPFSLARLAALRAQGRPVFVNMTAAWCVTCLLNERVAIQSEAVRDAFAQRHIAYLKGDWTRQAPEITSFLREHGRDGVPLYLYYPPGGGPPAQLPQLLTQQRLLDELAGPG